MLGKGDEQAAEGLASANASESAVKLSQETNQIGMTGLTGGAERIALTTLDGVGHIPDGLLDTAIEYKNHPGKIFKVIGESAGIAALARVILPEAGPVGRVAGLAMTGWLLWGAAPAFGHAYKGGLKANTWDELDQGGKLWGDAAGELAIDSGLGYVGYQLGARASGRILSSARFDAFADWKQDQWDGGRDLVKRLFSRGTRVPTAVSLGMRPNYLPQAAQNRATIANSADTPANSTKVGAVDPEAPMNASVYLQSKATSLRMDRYLARMADGREHSLDDVGGAFEEKFGASQDSLNAVSDFAKQNNLAVAESDLRSGRVFLSGKTADFQKAFGVELNIYATDVGTKSIGNEGDISMPSDLKPHIRAVLGMSTTPVAEPQLVRQETEPGGSRLEVGQEGPVLPEDYLQKGGYLATQIARAQNFPLSTGGEGQHGAFISVGGGIDLADYNKFFPEHGLPQPKPLRIVTVGGATNDVGTSGDVENALDGQQMQSLAPNAEITMIKGKNNQGMVDAFERAIFPKGDEAQNTVVSASWGLAENVQSPQLLNALHITFKQAAIRGVQVFSGSGDNGARAQQTTYQPEYPAADPNVTGVGGLKMILDNNDKLSWVHSWEEKYGSTGGGISKIFTRPWWQELVNPFKNLDTGLFGRGVPDISTNAASSTGYPVRVAGETTVNGGTSAGAPLYAGLMLNINAELAQLGIKPVTPLNPWMYARANDANIFHDVTTGGNYGYQAGKGWDPVTGLGWVDGTAMLNAMKLSQTTRVPDSLALATIGANPEVDEQQTEQKVGSPE